ncbi:MAG: hypothetical protein ACMXYB_05105 [Candidatus Woesearchaeota archaeon]
MTIKQKINTKKNEKKIKTEELRFQERIKPIVKEIFLEMFSKNQEEYLKFE